jgi:hypothetical protein
VDHRIRRLGLGLLILFVALFAQLTWLQAIDAGNLANHPGNTRNAVRDFGRLRGSILTADGRVIAESVENPTSPGSSPSPTAAPGSSGATTPSSPGARARWCSAGTSSRSC